MLKNKHLTILFAICTIFLFCFALPSYSEPAEATGEVKVDTIDTSIDEALNNTTEEVKTPHVEDIQEMTPNANDKLKDEIVNDTNNHLKGVIKKFLAVMLGVAVSSVIIYLIGILMNRFNILQDVKTRPKEEEETEEIPISNDENDALKIFLDKTK